MVGSSGAGNWERGAWGRSSEILHELEADWLSFPTDAL